MAGVLRGPADGALWYPFDTPFGTRFSAGDEVSPVAPAARSVRSTWCTRTSRGTEPGSRTWVPVPASRSPAAVDGSPRWFGEGRAGALAELDVPDPRT
ncbi:hypothetical protein [Streptomyces sp. NPDC005046]